MRTHALKLGLVLLAAASSGAAGLGHQSVWVRAMVDILGANTDTFSKVVGAFFVGLALGAGAASRWTAPAAGRWRWLIAAEAAVIVLAWPILLLHPVAGVLYGQAVFAALVPWLLPVLMVTPPAFMMGLFLPWLVHALACEGNLTPVRTVVLYALNTLGGVVGVALVILVALPKLGLTGTAVSVMGINALVIALLALLHLWRSGVAVGVEAAPIAHAQASALPNDERWRPGAFACALAFASGMAVLAMEVLFQHQVAQISINSLYSSGVVLAIVLLGLGVAPLLIPALRRLIGSADVLLAGALVLAALAAMGQPVLFDRFGGLEVVAYEELSPAAYGWALLQRMAVTLGPAVLAGGLVFPILLYQVTERAGGASGRAVGRLLMWNGLGGWLGAEAANLVLGPAWGLWQSMVVLAVIYLVFAVALAYRQSTGMRPSARGQLVCAATLAAALAGVWGYHVTGDLPQVDAQPAQVDRYAGGAGQGEGHGAMRVLEHRVGPEGVIAATESAAGDRWLVRNNLYTLGGTAAAPHQERQGHVPILLHGDARSVALLGTATGSTLAGVAMHDGVEAIEAIEISRDTQRLAERHFADHNHGVFDDPRVRVRIDDARWVVANRRRAYDVVIGDVFLPWKMGTGRLYTREHFEAVLASLKTDGIFCQWLPLYQLTERQFRAILATFQDVFADTLVVSVDFYSRTPMVGLVGGVSLAEHDWSATRVTARMLRERNATRDPLVRHAAGVQMLLIGEPPAIGPDVPRNTLANAWVELDAGRNVLGQREPWFVGSRFLEFAAAVREHSDAMVPQSLAKGQYFAELDHALRAEDPAARRMLALIRDHIPAALAEDREADWGTWPAAAQPDPDRLFR